MLRRVRLVQSEPLSPRQLLVRLLAVPVRWAGFNPKVVRASASLVLQGTIKKTTLAVMLVSKVDSAARSRGRVSSVPEADTSAP